MLDYVIVVFFLLVPTLFNLTGGMAVLAYVLAVAHLALALVTRFPMGMADMLSFGVHGVVELVIALALITMPWILSGTFWGAQGLYTVVGVVLFVVWTVTNYRPAAAAEQADRPPADSEAPGSTSPHDDPLQNW